jgi:hypothetical protein
LVAPPARPQSGIRTPTRPLQKRQRILLDAAFAATAGGRKYNSSRTYYDADFFFVFVK